MTQSRRVAVTGVGIISPFGIGKDIFFSGLAEGRSCVNRVARFDTSALPSKMACLVPSVEQHSSTIVNRLPMVYQFGVAAAEQALLDSGIQIGDHNRHRIAVIFATAGNTEQAEKYHSVLVEKGPRRVSPLWFQNTTYMAGPGTISILKKITGPAIALPGGYSNESRRSRWPHRIFARTMLTLRS